ncbi:MAG TPA: RDD family protein [Streptosporangiaceae bacterium]
MAEVVTGEAVVLDLTVARFPSRILALLIDVIVEVPAVFFLDVVAFLATGRHLNGAAAAAVFLSGLVLVIIGYPVIFETLSRGKTLGKLALGIRVVCDDGSPVRFRQALIRGLSLAFVELWIPPLTWIGLPAGLITSMVSAKGKRLGDMFAGTFVIQERVPRRPDLAPAFTVVPAQLGGWAQHAELSRLSDVTAAAASSYLRRFSELRAPMRDQLGIALATTVASQVSPPPPQGTDAAAYLAAVLAVRREREFVRLQERLAAQPPPPDQAPVVMAGLPATVSLGGAAVPAPGHAATAADSAGAQPEHGSEPVAPPGAVTLAKSGQQAAAPPEDPGFVAPY